MKITTSILAMSITLLFFGEKKWDPKVLANTDLYASEAYLLKAKIDGDWLEFNQENQLDASFGPFIDDIYDGVISASIIEPDTQTLTHNISISIRQSGKIGIGSYSGVKPFEYGLKGVNMSYTDESNRAIYITDVNNPKSFLKISEFTETHIKGTFSGELIHLINKTKLSITEGEFYIKSKNY